MSKFGSDKVFKNADKVVIFILADIIVTGLLTFGTTYLTNNVILNDNSSNVSSSSENTNTINNSSVSTVGAYEITTEVSEDGKTYKSENEDENSILVSDGGNLTLTNATINKTGDTTNTESSEFYGLNAAVLVKEKSTATISDSNITTNSKGSNAVFSTGSNSKIYISDTTINTSSDSSRGLDATYGGYIEADNVTITTQGNSCATLATDRGEGTVTVKNSTLETNGKGSPIIYSTGNITLSNSKGTSNGSQLVVIEGKNSASVIDSTLISSGIGNRNDVDNAGVMIYQSMSGDANEGTGTFTAKNSSLTIDSSSKVYKSAPMFFITNTDAVINLTNTKISYGSNKLISIKGTDEWGKSGSNGGNLTFNSTNESISGDIEVDNISTLVINLKNSTLSSAINSDNSAKSIEINLDENSKLNITGDSYITILNDDDKTYSNIKSNGYTIYYDSSSNSNLGGKTINLADGGKLTPVK